MVIDTSAIVAILFDEPERRRFNELIEEDSHRYLSAAMLVEASLVLEMKHGDLGAQMLDVFVRQAGFEIVPFDRDQTNLAREAFRRFGKGRHQARLSFGDCCAYALSAFPGEPLLFKGQDFAHTDVLPKV
ncbi:MAG: type II toxin-antitoxin system VapC family toxin [Alphaproteobacteria bacterium]|nr:type II toxin-antitoxin system VapC family toxin [Alphaproteobacteria bacterium]